MIADKNELNKNVKTFASKCFWFYQFLFDENFFKILLENQI